MSRRGTFACLAISVSLIFCAASSRASEKRDAIFVLNRDYITIYPLDAKGDVAPVCGELLILSERDDEVQACQRS